MAGEQTKGNDMAKDTEETHHKTLAIALAHAQMAMGKALKTANNPHFKSKYADLSAVMDACLPALNEAGIAVVQPPFEADGARYVKTIFMHESGETLECSVPLIVAKNDMQGFGSAVTYARRYGLMCLAGIAPEDDDGNAAAKAPPVEQKRPAPEQKAPPQAEQAAAASFKAVQAALDKIAEASTNEDLDKAWRGFDKSVKETEAVLTAAKEARAALAAPIDDEIPY